MYINQSCHLYALRSAIISSTTDVSTLLVLPLFLYSEIRKRRLSDFKVKCCIIKTNFGNNILDGTKIRTLSYYKRRNLSQLKNELWSEAKTILVSSSSCSSGKTNIGGCIFFFLAVIIFLVRLFFSLSFSLYFSFLFL
jgi:hypothetical protein